MQLPILQDIVIILGLSVVIILLFQKLRLPAILGFLLTGIIAGPHGLNLISATHEVELLSEIGIIFLLFVIGIEFSLKGLSTVKNTVLIGGLFQVGGTIALTALFSYMLGMTIPSAIFMGFLISLSSTAIVLKLLQEQGELTSPHGRISVAILIFQDIIVVLMMLLTPLLAGEMENPGTTLAILVVKVVGVIVVVIALARYIVPNLFTLVVKSKSQELFILTVVVICFATAWLTSSIGLSLALGAFFAGLIISESSYSHQATANILPFREIFISFFFVSVGMLLDLSFFIDHVVNILLLAIGVIFLKIIVIAITVLILNYPPRTIILTALSLFQVGEFAFLLSTSGMKYNLLSQEFYQYFLAISIITIGITPFIMKFSSSIAQFILHAPLPGRVKRRLKVLTHHKAETTAKHEDELKDHLVIIGYGINGENVAKTARQAKIPYVIVELDPVAINKANRNKEPVVFGDASNDVILKHVHIQEARVIVIAISSPESTKRIMRRVREFTKTAFVIVRTRYVREVEEIVGLGADVVIPEEFETSIEIFTRVLKKYLMPNNEIMEFVNQIRSHNYEMLRSIPGFSVVTQANIPDMEIATLPVHQGVNKVVGKSVQESGIRSNFNITVLAIKRGEKYITRVTPETIITQDDILFLFGSPNSIIALNKFLMLN
ncbi:MAG TPA: cation:proton antiporter [Cyclobacteriaceae bacterium]|jgi:CPA2 family monovalent cation:H+ antiporter-2